MSYLKNKELWILIALMIFLLPVDFRLSTGLFLGFLCSILHFRLIELQYGRISRPGGNLFLYGNVFFRLVLLGAPILVSVLLPDYFHWAGVAVGLLFNKYSLFIKHYVSYKRMRSSISKG